MKLSEVQTARPIRDTPGASSSKTYFRATDGWELTLEQGVVTIKKGDLVRHVAFAACDWVSPFVKVKPPEDAP